MAEAMVIPSKCENDKPNSVQGQKHRPNIVKQEPASDFAHMMAKLTEEMSSKDEYPFSKCSYVTVANIGRTRTGKSTIAKMLENPFHVLPPASLFAETRNIIINRITTLHNGNSYFFTIIDTPGLYDCTRNEGERLTNHTIKRSLDQCITRDITHIHAFAFVVSSSGGINVEDIQSMIFIQKNYPLLKNFFMLVITHCEEKNETERQSFVRQFFKHRDVVQYGLQDFFGLGVHFTGCLRSQLERAPNLMAARTQATNILEMRQKLLDFLISREETINIHYEPADNSLLDKVFRFCCNLMVIIGVLAILLAILAK